MKKIFIFWKHMDWSICYLDNVDTEGGCTAPWCKWNGDRICNI